MKVTKGHNMIHECTALVTIFIKLTLITDNSIIYFNLTKMYLICKNNNFTKNFNNFLLYFSDYTVQQKEIYDYRLLQKDFMCRLSNIFR